MQLVNRNEWLQNVKEVLMQEGFSGTILQVIEPGQVFGLVRKQDEIWEMHVRGFADGRLEAEIEISRDYFEHLNDNYRRDATLELIQILKAYQVPYQTKGTLPEMQVTLHPPKQLTPWKPIATLVGVVVFLIWLGRQGD